MTQVMTDKDWERTRDFITQRNFGVSALEFVQEYNSGSYDNVDDPFPLEETLFWFPELW